MSSQFDVISIGSATIDAILKSKDFKVVKNKGFETGLAICEMYGSKTSIDDFYIGSGGGATNSSCSLSHLGMKTSCVSVVGDDVFSEFIYDDLLKYKVGIDNLIVEKNKKTAFSTILTAPDGGRTVMVYRGPCSNITKKSIESQKLDTGWVYLTNLGTNFENAKEVILFLKEKDIKVFWNPGLNEMENADISFLENIDVLNINVEEASKLSNLSMENVKEILKFFVKNTSKCAVLLTLAEKGAFFIQNKQIIHVSSFKVTVENTVGAGDAFGSGFLYGFANDLGIERSLEYGIKNSVSVIQKTGAKEGFLQDINTLPKPNIKKISN